MANCNGDFGSFASPPETGSTYASQLVAQGYTYYGRLAATAYNGAQCLLRATADAARPTNPFDDVEDVDFAALLGSASGVSGDSLFETPKNKPDVSRLDLTFSKPQLAGSYAFQPLYTPSFGTAPVFVDPGVSFEPVQKPDTFSGSSPGAAPSVGAVFIPAAPDIVLPPVPTGREITIPDAEEITLPDWNELAPGGDIPVPTGEFVWADADYTSLTLDQVTARIQTMLQGGTGLPDAIWNMIWDRARVALYEQRDAAIDEATERWAARGFSVPGGALNKQIDRAIRAFENASAEQLRETAIKQAEMEVANMQFAVAQGISLETQLMSLYNQRAARSLEALKYAFDMANAIFSARIQKYNADVQAYQAKAQVHKTLIDAELSKLEEYKLRLEGQKLIGELNMQDVQIYTAQVEALAKEVDIFRAQLEGVKAQVDVDKTRVEAFATEVNAYGEQIKAKSLEYQAYESEVKAELGKAEVYKAQVEAFSTRVKAYESSVQAENIKVEADVKREAAKLEAFKGYLAKYEADIKAEMSTIDANAKKADIEARIFGTLTDAEKARVGAILDEHKAKLAEAEQRVNLELKKAEVNISNITRQMALEMEAYKAMAQVQGQLAASAMSAVNLSGSVGYSSGKSDTESYSENHNYSY